MVWGTPVSDQSPTESNTYMLQMMVSATEETEQGRGIGSANGGGGMSIFKKAFRKASLDSNLSVGSGKKERESETHRVRQHRIQNSGMAFRTKGTSLTPSIKEASRLHKTGLLGGIYHVQHAQAPSTCPGGQSLQHGIKKMYRDGTPASLKSL